MSRVYFIKNEGTDYQELGRDALELLKRIESDTGHRYEKELPLKVHFGERGNRTYMPPACYDAIIQYPQYIKGFPHYILRQVSYIGVEGLRRRATSR